MFKFTVQRRRRAIEDIARADARHNKRRRLIVGAAVQMDVAVHGSLFFASYSIFRHIRKTQTQFPMTIN